MTNKEDRERYEAVKAELKAKRKAARNKANREYDEAIREAKLEILGKE